METVHRFPLPIVRSPQLKIWRYLTPSKFLALLDDRSLFFPNTELFEDPFEGAYPDANRALQDHIFANYPVTEDQQKAARDFYKWNKHLTFVSCWHLSEHESDALWKIYGKTEKAVLIQSTYLRLKSCLPNYVHIHPVTYIDYKVDRIPNGHSMYPFFFKRREFKYENELRAATGDLPISDHVRRVRISDNGWSFPINVNKLIESVYVAPECPEETYICIKNASLQRGLVAPVLPSSLDAQPRF